MDIDTFSRDQLFDVANQMTEQKGQPKSHDHLKRIDNLLQDITSVANQTNKNDFQQQMKNLDSQFKQRPNQNAEQGYGTPNKLFRQNSLHTSHVKQHGHTPQTQAPEMQQDKPQFSPLKGNQSAHKSQADTTSEQVASQPQMKGPVNSHWQDPTNIDEYGHTIQPNEDIKGRIPMMGAYNQMHQGMSYGMQQPNNVHTQNQHVHHQQFVDRRDGGVQGGLIEPPALNKSGMPQASGHTQSMGNLHMHSNGFQRDPSQQRLPDLNSDQNQYNMFGTRYWGANETVAEHIPPVSQLTYTHNQGQAGSGVTQPMENMYTHQYHDMPVSNSRLFNEMSNLKARLGTQGQNWNYGNDMGTGVQDGGHLPNSLSNQPQVQQGTVMTGGNCGSCNQIDPNSMMHRNSYLTGSQGSQSAFPELDISLRQNEMKQQGRSLNKQQLPRNWGYVDKQDVYQNRDTMIPRELRHSHGMALEQQEVDNRTLGEPHIRVVDEEVDLDRSFASSHSGRSRKRSQSRESRTRSGSRTRSHSATKSEKEKFFLDQSKELRWNAEKSLYSVKKKRTPQDPSQFNLPTIDSPKFKTLDSDTTPLRESNLNLSVAEDNKKSDNIV